MLYMLLYVLHYVCMYVYIYIYIYIYIYSALPEAPSLSFSDSLRRSGRWTGLGRRRENMVGVNMVLAQYPQTTPYHRIYIVHV